MKKPTLLFLTDLNYEAAGRAYYTEDIMLTGELKDTFDIILADPRSSEPFESHVDAIVIRNSGPITHYLEAFGQFKKRVIQQGLKTFNSMDGKADMRGKYYLPKLCQAGYQVTPSIADPKAIDQLPEATEYVVKPMLGADSIGLKFVERAAIETLPSNEYVIQPRLDIQEEHSLFFLNNQFCYALKTAGNRWELVPFEPDEAELKLAETFIAWNQMKNGIQRVDFAKTHEGLFLVELEDINPFLSLELLKSHVRQNFIDRMKQALLRLIQ
jgi:hypothetical protein